MVALSTLPDGVREQVFNEIDPVQLVPHPIELTYEHWSAGTYCLNQVIY